MLDPTKPNNNLMLLSPYFRLDLELAIKDLHQAGFNMYMFEGWRSPSRQDYLYEQGRSAPGKIITKAKRWQSWHQFGQACDLVYKVNNAWSWEGDFAKPAEIMRRYGFTWGGSFGDGPHYEKTGGFSLDEAKAIMEQHGIQALWIAINERSSTARIS